MPTTLARATQHAVPVQLGRAGLDPLLDPLSGSTRLIIAGSDADLAAVVLRLMRTERLAELSVGYLPAQPRSAVAATWGLPVAPDAAAALASHGEPDLVPLVRDDAGGVLLGRGELRPVRGVIYCDDELVLRGQADRLVVTPAQTGVAVRAERVSLLGLRSRTATGRAVQIGCLSAAVTCDGVTRPTPVTRWTWYRHEVDLRLVRGLP
ncbi:MAG: hypothetical protein JO100_07230 [Pseudonocardia sp.]|nr:hypothetical protein [Pseudonocardia sp.]